MARSSFDDAKDNLRESAGDFAGHLTDGFALLLIHTYDDGQVEVRDPRRPDQPLWSRPVRT